MLYFLLFMKLYPFLSNQLHSLSFPKYINCFQSTDFFIIVYSILVTDSFLYWILDWTSILNITWTVIAHVKQIKAANLIFKDILYIPKILEWNILSILDWKKLERKRKIRRKVHCKQERFSFSFKFI